MPPDTLHHALHEQAPRQAQALAELLAYRSRLTHALTLDLDDTTRRALTTALEQTGRDALALLDAWSAAGGVVRLRGPDPSTGDASVNRETTPVLRGRDHVPEEAGPSTLSYGDPPASDVEPSPRASSDPVQTTPAAAPAPPPCPSGPPATARSLEALADHVAEGGLFSVPEGPSPTWRRDLAALTARLGPGQDLEAERDRLVDAARHCGDWDGLPRHAQQHLIGNVAARLRYLQDEAALDAGSLNPAFHALTKWSKRVQPGFVFGLTRSHRPRHGPSWDDDAERHWDQLTALLPDDTPPAPNHEQLLDALGSLVPEIEAAPSAMRDVIRRQVVRRIGEALDAGIDARDPRLVKLAQPVSDHLDGRNFKRLRRAVRDAELPDEDGEDVQPVPIPEDWAWAGHTRGRRAVVLGGSPREHARQRLQDAFGFAELEWMPAENRSRGLQTLKRRIEGGTVDLVLILSRFVGHDADFILVPATKGADVSRVHVEHGYGVNRVRSAIERFLEPDAGAEE